MGGVGNGAAKEDWCWNLNLGMAAIPERGLHGFGGVGGENHAALAEWGPCGSDTADGAGSLNHGLLLLFLIYGSPDWEEGKGRTMCICGYSEGLKYFNEDITSLL